MKILYTQPITRILLLSAVAGYMQSPIVGSAGAQGHAGVIKGNAADTDYDYEL